MIDCDNREANKEGAALGSRHRRLGVVVSYVNAVASMIVSLLYVPILLSGIGQNEYGLYQLIGSIMAYMTIMNSIFSAGATRFYCVALEKGDTELMERTLATCQLIYRIAALAVVIVGAVAICIFSMAYQNALVFYQVVEGCMMIAILVINVIVTMNNTINVAVINANERFGFLKASQLLTTLLQPLLIVLLINYWPYAITIVAVQFSLNIACAIIQRIYARRRLRARVGMHGLDLTLVKSILVYSGGILLAAIADQVFWRSNQLVIGYMYGTSEVAVYGVATQICMAYLALGNVIMSVFMPRVTGLHARGLMDEISRLFSKVGRLSLYILLLVFGEFFVVGNTFIDLWAGDGYGDAYYIALIIMTAFTLDSAQSLGITILQVVNKYKFRARIYFVLAVLNVACVLLVAPKFGGIGCAIVSCALMLMGNGFVMNLYYSRKVGLDIGGYWAQSLKVIVPIFLYILCAFTMWRVVHFPVEWGYVILGCALFCVGYSIVAYRFCMNAYEKGLIQSIFKKIKLHRA